VKNPQQYFDDEILPRWPEWQPTAQQANDWYKLIAPCRLKDVEMATTKLAYECEFKKPSLKVMKRLLKDCYIDVSEYRKEAYLIEQETGQKATIILTNKQPFSDDLLTEMAIHEAGKRGKIYGGKWIAYTNITWGEAMKISDDIQRSKK